MNINMLTRLRIRQVCRSALSQESQKVNYICIYYYYAAAAATNKHFKIVYAFNR